MNTNLLRRASRDGLGVRRWIVGKREGRHVKIFLRPAATLAGDTNAPWMVQPFNGEWVDHFAHSQCHTTFTYSARMAFTVAIEHLAPIQ